MHIPDGFIDPVTAAAAGVVAATGAGVALRKAGRDLDDRLVPLAGLVAAYVFAGQMVNFPVAGGTSGHLLGGALAAVLVGPWLGVLCLTVVVAVQALLFADGGLSALGLNTLNMALVATLGGYVAFRVVHGASGRRQSIAPLAAGVAAWVSVVLASLAFSAEYAVGGAGGADLATVTSAMVGVHVLIGVGEGVITALTVGAVLAARPDLVRGIVVERPAPTAGPDPVAAR